MKEKTSPLQKSLNVWAIALILWALYRYNLTMPIWFDEVIAKPLIFIAPVLLYIYHYEHTSLAEALWFRIKDIKKDLILGLGFGGIFIASLLLASTFLPDFIKQGSFNYKFLIMPFLLALCTGISEEILSRGFIVKRLFEDSHNIWDASFKGSLLFFVIHLPALLTTANLNGQMLTLFMIINFLLGFSNSLLFLTRKSLLLPILVNAFFNFVIIAYLSFA